VTAWRVSAGRHYRRLAGVFGVTGLALASALAVDRRLLPLALLPFAPTLYRQTRFKYRHAGSLPARALIPVATVNGLVASLAGFLAGRTQRRRARGS
jgi:hypothetical protein